MDHDEFQAQIIGTWKDESSPNYNYFKVVEDSTAGFWQQGTAFRRLFNRLDIEELLEIACGQGRHTALVPPASKRIFAMDTSVDAIKVAAERFRHDARITAYVSEDGCTIPQPDESFTGAFSYDAMVHFEPLTMASYLKETARVLKPGKMALFHHSAYDKNPTGKFTDSPSWRNYMTTDLFNHFASRAGLKAVEQIVFDWGPTPQSDCLTLLQKTTG